MMHSRSIFKECSLSVQRSIITLYECPLGTTLAWRFAGERSAVESSIRLGDRLGSECAHGIGPSVPSELSLELRISQQPVQCTGEERFVTDRHEQSSFSVENDIRYAARCKRNNRGLAEERFDGREAQAFITSRNHENRRAPIDVGQVGLRKERQPIDAIGESKLARHSFQMGIVDAASSDHIQRWARAHHRHGAQEVVQALLFREFSNEQQTVASSLLLIWGTKQRRDDRHWYDDSGAPGVDSTRALGSPR